MKRRSKSTRTLTTAIGLSLSALGLSASLSQAEGIECGQILSGGHFQLTTDLTCSCAPGAEPLPVLTVEGPAVVDLNGHVLSCESGCDGILITGKGAEVFNGIIRGCEDGVTVSGTGHHLITRVTAQSNTSDGFETTSSRNFFLQNTAKENQREGINLTGESRGNLFVNNEASFNGRNGFFMELVSQSPIPTQHVFLYNAASHNTQGGFQIQTGGNYLLGNSADANGRQGLKTEGGNHNTLILNTASSNCRDGIEIENGANNRVQSNVAEHNGNAEACPAGNFPLGIDFRPWFYAGFDSLAGAGHNLLSKNFATDNLGCWVPPEKRTPPETAWIACVGFVPTTREQAREALRNRNLWDENAVPVEGAYECTSTNQWVNNQVDGDKTAEPECPCVEDFGEECVLADR